MSYRVKSLTCLDSKSTKDIFHEVFHKDEWREFRWIWRYRSRVESVGIFDASDNLLGFALILPHSRELKYIGIHPNFQNLRLGSVLLKHILKTCANNRHSLNLVPANDVVEAWYYKNGFRLSQYFIATDSTRWKIMNYHPYFTRSRLKPN